MFIKATLPILKLFGQFFLILICCLLIVLIPFTLVSSFWGFYYRFIRKMKPKKRTYTNTQRRRNIFLLLFVDFPRRFVLDLLQRDPDEFDQYGLWCFTGVQGSGKSIALVEMLHGLKSKFPRLRILSNIPITGLNSETIQGPEDFVFVDNGKNGTVVVLDEAQNWFNSAESRNFPPEVLQEICQERKQHKMVCMTTQRFNRLSAALREQVDYYVKPFTIAGCLTVVRIYRPAMKEFDAQIVKLRRIKTYCFVHSDELRGSYDTRAKVRRLTLKGWKPRDEHLTGDTVNVESVKGKRP